ncbi:MAG: insulinase family protein [Myxococcales bacterium]|nr:insulinase family protein [Myxococcales bacterium]
MRKPLFAAVAAAVLASAGVASATASVTIPFEKTKLSNGMTVILHEDHSVPVVVVNVSYNVGSRFEAPKRTGFAHLFEHLMFMGTRRAPTKMFDAWMEAAGGWNNAWTSEDRTDYYDVGPSTSLDLLLWLEADRLRDLGPLMTLDKLNAQREVVRNERRQTSENTPYGKVELVLPELLYPAGHPYHHPVIGSHEDLEAATVADVVGFFDQFYDPGNASIVVAGDFDKKKGLDRVRALFEPIPTRAKYKDPGAPGFDDKVTTLKGVVRKTIQDDVELAKVVMAWQTPKRFGAGDAELDVVSSVLTSGKASRLYQALVYDQKIAQSVEASQQSGALGSRFVIGVLAKPGVPLEKIEKAVDAELVKIAEKGITEDELLRAKNGIESAFVTRLQTVRERASLLNMYEAEVKNPGYADQDLLRYTSATRERVRETSAKYLAPNARVILHVQPAAKKGGDQ